MICEIRPGRMTHILLIDDHPLFCDGFTASCRTLRPGFTVTTVDTAAAGRQMLAEVHPLSCVLIDIMLPDADGFDTLQHLARLDPLTPRVMISGRDDRTARLRAQHQGASGFLSKSARPEAIMAALDIILAGGVWFDDRGAADDDDDDDLTPRQLEVLDLLAQGCANKEIETRLNLAERTVRAHMTEIFKSLGVQGRVRAVMEARRRGLIT